MTLRINLSDELAGCPIGRIRHLVRLYSGSTWGEGAVEFVLDVGAREAHRVTAELERLGYIERTADGKWWRNTEAATRLAMATAAPAIHRRTADALLRGLLDRLTIVDREPGYLIRVTSATAFGSYARGADRLSDVDVMLGMERKERDPDRASELRHASLREARGQGRVFRSLLAEHAWPEKKVWLFLRARKRSLSLVELDDETRQLLESGPTLVLYHDGQVTAEARARLGLA